MSELGTPENPEIIEPGQNPRGARTFTGVSRWRLVPGFLATMLAITAPAALAFYCTAWLIKMGWAGQVFAWVLLIPVLPVTLALVLAAVALDGFMVFLLLGLLMGRTHVHVGGMNSPRDVFRTTIRTIRPR